MTTMPALADIMANAHVFTVQLAQPFRGVTSRSGIVFEGPHGWGEFAPFVDHSVDHASQWLRAAIEIAYSEPVAAIRHDVAVNAIIPETDALTAKRMVLEAAGHQGVTTFKVKCGSSDFSKDCERVAAVRSALNEIGAVGSIRIDINGLWSVAEAAERIIELNAQAGGLQYVEQPAASLRDCIEVRERTGVPQAVDEGIRLHPHPLQQVSEIRAAGDIAILKAIPAGGVRAALNLAEMLGMPVVVSGSLDTSIGLQAGFELAAALPELSMACGLGTGTLLRTDLLQETVLPVAGHIHMSRKAPDASRLTEACDRVDSSEKQQWLSRLEACYKALEVSG
jgi:O-succinylbenzoate synthase